MNDHAESLRRQATALHRAGRRPEAIETYRQLLAILPQSTDSWYDLGYLLKAEGKYDDALTAYEQALARGVVRPEEVHLNRAVIYTDHLRRDEEAERELKAALALDAEYVPALLNLGNLHEERGERQDALSCYDRIAGAAANKDNAFQDLRLEALARTTNLRPPTSIDDPLFQQLRDASSVAMQHGNIVRANLLFALGKAYDKLGEFDHAFAAFDEGNLCLVRQTGRAYDRELSSRRSEALIGSFPSANQPAATFSREVGASPLFICGMFRSGTTLVEQVLAAHPRVTPGGELDYLLRLAAGPLAPFPTSMATPDPVREAVLGDDYLAHLARLFPAAKASTYITDKRPDNFLLIGLIKRLFPAAKIIHCIRHPLDNGLSIFMQHLNHQVAGYSSALTDIGHYYGQYRRLMAHWKALYPDDIFDFDYDDFVRGPQAALEPLFGFLGLDWDDRCLEFHRLGNTVKTASYWQVRRPLYSDASGRWRHYAAHLEPLRLAMLDGDIAAAELR